MLQSIVKTRQQASRISHTTTWIHRNQGNRTSTLQNRIIIQYKIIKKDLLISF